MLVKPGSEVSLKDIDPDDTGSFHSVEKAQGRLKEQVKELDKLQYLLHAEGRRALLIVLQGMDTSGKDGTIRHVMAGMSPLGVRVQSFKAPNEEERAHDYLWRVHQALPCRGEIGIFNRSHYEDVLIVRVHEMVPKDVWKPRYEQINEFEKMLVANDVVILKFFLHISKGEQQKRLRSRLDDPDRIWKFSSNDVNERQYWTEYRKAYEAVLEKCSTKWAPWHIVPANQKWYRNLVVAETIVETLKALKMKFPAPKEDVSKIIVELMRSD